MSPESIDNKQYSIKSDVFSYGVVLYELTSRMDPWKEMNAAKAAYEVLSGRRMEIPKDCPPILSNIMNLCWKQDPIERPNFYDIIQLLKEKNTNNNTSENLSFKDDDSYEKDYNLT